MEQLETRAEAIQLRKVMKANQPPQTVAVCTRVADVEQRQREPYRFAQENRPTQATEHRHQGPAYEVEVVDLTLPEFVDPDNAQEQDLDAPTIPSHDSAGPSDLDPHVGYFQDPSIVNIRNCSSEHGDDVERCPSEPLIQNEVTQNFEPAANDSGSSDLEPKVIIGKHTLPMPKSFLALSSEDRMKLMQDLPVEVQGRYLFMCLQYNWVKQMFAIAFEHLVY